MTYATRTALILSLIFSLIGGAASAQETTTTTATTTAPAVAAPATTTASGSASQDTPEGRSRTRESIVHLLGRHPSSVTRLLSTEPRLLLNEPFLADYPDLAKFVADHPEVRRNPHYYVGNLVNEHRPRNSMDEAVESFTIMATFALIAFALAWLVRTIIEQKRWNRLSRTQTEVHNKILDRFGSSEELLQYIKTDAGSKFLESAPIPLHADRRPAQNTPAARILWSIQLGVVIAVAALGMLLVGLGFEGETAQGLFAIGAITFTVGAGFIASAFVSMIVSRRLGLWQGPDAPPPIDDSVVMR